MLVIHILLDPTCTSLQHVPIHMVSVLHYEVGEGVQLGISDTWSPPELGISEGLLEPLVTCLRCM